VLGVGGNGFSCGKAWKNDGKGVGIELDQVQDQVRDLLAQGNKIEAIKLVRQHTVWGLKESKDYGDRLGSW
jgi:ribosomal protein L7/L12